MVNVFLMNTLILIQYVFEGLIILYSQATSLQKLPVTYPRYPNENVFIVLGYVYAVNVRANGRTYDFRCICGHL